MTPLKKVFLKLLQKNDEFCRTIQTSAFGLAHWLMMRFSVTKCWIKKLPNVSKRRSISGTCVYQNSPKNTKYLDFFCKKNVAKNFQKSPKLVTLMLITKID